MSYDAIWNLLSDLEKHLLIFELCLSKLDFSEVPCTLKIYDSQNTWAPKKCRGGCGGMLKGAGVADIQGCISLRQRKRGPGASASHESQTPGTRSVRTCLLEIICLIPVSRTATSEDTVAWLPHLGALPPFPVTLSSSVSPQFHSDT